MDGVVRENFDGKTVFITGATGFIGKVLLEKLLYSCSKIKSIYVLIRSKNSAMGKNRLHKLLQLPVFDRLRKENSEALEKIVAIEGDLIDDSLGLNDASVERLQQEVNIVYHCAATLKLEANLKDSVKMNLVGTWRVLELCKGMKNLDIFVHLSTAFCYADHEVVRNNEVFPEFESPHDIIRMCEWMSEDSIEIITKKLLKHHPNTYTYTKRLAEVLVSNEYPQMPCVIARPSIVTPSCSEPIPGWVDSLNGPVGLMLAAGKGVIRTMHCDPDINAEMIPVDYVVNGLIVMTQALMAEVKTSTTIPAVNLSLYDCKTFTWGDILQLSRETVAEYPFDYPLWYPDGGIHKQRWIHKLNELLFHWIPAIFIDILLLVLGKKRFMIRLQKRISTGLNLLEFFTNRVWKFENVRYKELYTNMNEEERKIFPMDLSKVDERDYMKKCIIGGRLYCMKEPLESLPKARMVNKVMYYIDRMIKCTVIYYFLRMVYWYFTSYSI